MLVDRQHLEQDCNKEGLVAVYFKVWMVTVLTLLQEKCGRPKVYCGSTETPRQWGGATQCRVRGTGSLTILRILKIHSR